MIGQGIQRAAFLLFLLTLVWAPFPLGSNRPWAWSLLALLLAVALALHAAGALVGGSWGHVPGAVKAAALLWAAVSLWALLQAAPGLVPAAWVHPFWWEVGEAGLEVSGAASLSPELVWDALLRLWSFALAFALAFLFAQRSERARVLFRTLAAAATGYALYGLVIHFGGLDWIVPGVERTYRLRLSSTFVNPNNYATYANLALLVVLGLLFARIIGVASITDIRKRLQELLDGLLGRNGFLLLALFLIASASLLTASRGGFLSLAAALWVFLLLLYLLTRPRRRNAALALALTAAVGWGLVSLSGELLLFRLEVMGTGNVFRLNLYELSLAMAGERPFLGHGYGSYPDLFRLYRDERFGVGVTKAHNTYLEHAAELGLPATFLLYLAPLILFLFLFKGLFQRRRQQLYPLVAAAATVMVALHALVDFSIQIPAVGVTYAAILGTGVAQAIPSRLRRPTRPRAASRSRPERALQPA